MVSRGRVKTQLRTEGRESASVLEAREDWTSGDLSND